ncbi:NAD(P)-binding protein [Mollisia scopiformis]|uniref:NAD(P)-binding protein n=1 Tax=Mollisia scopiformis TaxID=149040 RepID=A0A194XC99_MOLSC|nr:NAD(P)-binding protein [Mollisia scopiformis]KUJ17377.1 NAD(P)-binding protein [Mollisia scopiformis]
MASKKLLVVFGATGNQGGSVLTTVLKDSVLSEQFKLRGITRDPSKASAATWTAKGVQMVKGDLEDKESLRAAIKDAYAVFAVTNWQEVLDKEREIQQGKNIADVCKELNVQHLIWSSLPNVTKITNGTNTGVLHFDSKATVEEYMKSIGIPSTFLLLGIFMHYTLLLLTPLPGIPHSHTLKLPTPTTSTWPLISCSVDVGKYVKSILLNRDSMLGRQILAGEREYTVEETAEVLRKVGGLDVRAEQVTEGEYRKLLEEKGWPAFLRDDMVANIGFIEEWGFFGGEGVERDHGILTEKLETFEEWVAGSKEVVAMNIHQISTIRSVMAPPTPLPFSAEFESVDDYVDSLLLYCGASTVFQTLCGGVHILDFFTREPSLYHTAIPEEWRDWLMARESMDLLDFLMRDDLNQPRDDSPPESLLKYIREIRKYSLQRNVSSKQGKGTKLPRHIAVGMIPKKIHEVGNFANYVVRVADDVSSRSGKEITHFVDFGSGQNYLGRTLASPPYNKHIVAVESKELNINGAKSMDVLAGVAEREKVMRNKKLYRLQQDSITPQDKLKEKALRRNAKPQKPPTDPDAVDMRPSRDLATIYTPADGKGYIQYVEHVVQDGDLSNVVEQIEQMKIAAPVGNLQVVNGDPEKTQLPEIIDEISKTEDTRLMAISIHSCGNLSHHGIRSLLLNPSVKAIAIVGCCYNLMTERLGPPTYKLPRLRPNQRAINAPRLTKEAAACDPHGFPMSRRVSTYNGDGVRLNITARMMAVQAPQNWTEKESDAFFTRHFYRALLQKVFLDRGVVSKMKQEDDTEDGSGLESTEPVIIGSLRKGCYGSFRNYVRGALEKLNADPERSKMVGEKMADMTDEEIDEYSRRYEGLKKELSVTWSLMAFSAGVVESLIVVDRWLFLREHSDAVEDCWVEAVFDYQLSPRNLVVVGIKR